MLFRHWTLYEATYHSSYVAGKLGWKERGRKRLTGLLAKMGCVSLSPSHIFYLSYVNIHQNSFSIPQTQQPYTHVDIDLKSTLCSKLEAIAPEYGLLELSYTSFTRRFGYRSPPLSAADAVEAVSALLDVAGGVRMEIEVEGARNGGGRVWEVEGARGRAGGVEVGKTTGEGRRREGEAEGEREEGEKEEKMEVEWWKKNFWTAFDALSE
jgi:cell division control protein 45